MIINKQNLTFKYPSAIFIFSCSLAPMKARNKPEEAVLLRIVCSVRTNDDPPTFKRTWKDVFRVLVFSGKLTGTSTEAGCLPCDRMLEQAV